MGRGRDGETGGKRGTGTGTQRVKAGRGLAIQVHALHEQKIASADRKRRIVLIDTYARGFSV